MNEYMVGWMDGWMECQRKRAHNNSEVHHYLRGFLNTVEYFLKCFVWYQDPIYNEES